MLRSLSPESPEAAVGLHVLGRPHRSGTTVHVGVTVKRGAAAGRGVISFFKRRQKQLQTAQMCLSMNAADVHRPLSL